MSGQDRHQRQKGTTDLTRVQIDGYGFKVHLHGSPPNEPRPRNVREWATAIGEKLVASSLHVFGFVEDVLVAARSIVRGIGGIGQRMDGSPATVARAHAQADAREDQLQSNRASGDAPAPDVDGADQQLVAVLQQLKDKGVAGAVCEVRPGVYAIVIVPPGSEEQALAAAIQRAGSSAQSQPGGQLPPMPEIGHDESWYARRVHEADRSGDAHAHAAYKVGQYTTLAMDHQFVWEERLKYFRHALTRHCQPPLQADDRVRIFYHNLADFVRQHAGLAALRIASEEDDLYAARLNMGQTRQQIEDAAEVFFGRLIPSDECPEWFLPSDYSQLKLIRDQWV